MSVYIPLATKYRPQKFADVIGQDIAVRIITHGMQKNRLGAALLFSGTHGVGKTTVARILAKAFRCEEYDRSDPEPCCRCASCLGFASDNQTDVVETDAASNTSVDDVREIIESCQYRPISGRYRVFIIDEVHMLSKSAFNALLKTLEEPPPHVKFLLATTETHKIPETILSRVLRFDLKRVDLGLVAQYLSSICNQEHISAGAETLSLIASAGDGSIRDSLSILDQAINMSANSELTIQNVRDMLGVSDDADIIDLLRLILNGSLKDSIAQYRRILESNISAPMVVRRLMDCVYILTCSKANVEPQESMISENALQKLEKLSQIVSLPALSLVWQMLLKGIEELKLCDHPEVVLEMILARISYASELPDLHEIIAAFSGTSEKSSSKKLANEKPSNSLFDEAKEMFPNATVY
ncbi:MAG: DNA polymerase III subunit gamma/tau [Holosporaceae bacterium]|jgi:DNA polymerase-3 subunit gamma/tau|nr:DNA polymerase III subunit gamma/tau [Holosporaceae bacterium]